MKFIVFNEQGVLSARYDSDINGASIPIDALEVDDELFFKTINEQDGIWSLVNGEVVKLPLPEPTVDDLINSKRREVNVAFNTTIKQITDSYPADEISSWDKQEAEARAFTADFNAVTPLIDAIALARGITKAELAARIISKADLFAGVRGELIGYRQGLEDQLDVLQANVNTTVEQVAEIVWAR
jgi:ribosomal protein S20